MNGWVSSQSSGVKIRRCANPCRRIFVNQFENSIREFLCVARVGRGGTRATKYKR